MGMSRDEILSRMVTGAAYIERSDITKAERDRYWARYNELEAELMRITAAEASYTPPTSDQVQSSMEKIRETLKKEGKRA